MAKRRTAQKEAATNIEAQRHRRDVMKWVREREQRCQPTLTFDEPLTSDLLKQPGELERVLTGIKQGFVQADQRHRTAIDHEVMRCVRVARFLNAHFRKPNNVLGGKWLEHWRKHKKVKTEALRFVFLQTHADAKKASLYYRAIYTIFDENVLIEDIPARVTAGGGYQALADANVRFPRKAPVEEVGNDKKPKPSKLKLSDSEGDDGDDEQSERIDGNDTSDEGDETEEPAPKVTLLATFDQDGRSFLDLPLPCYVTVVMHVTAGPGKSRRVRISHTELAE
ncbi:hypothetical protein ASG63_20480 [Methylobacterium sp. Leaf94]|uniref:hypothetical protein n=1 Tax=Methylobacterium sp. Leaf94 TaxID=1736250 RepID=UPI0006F97C54|nr:hypothetical protein [Methylobacterium sp. Leaf94]KQU25489.1 hypothetical protein ASG63_20480 [Methylobacterium sp. Leaf94]